MSPSRHTACDKRLSVITIGSRFNGDDGAPRAAAAAMSPDLSDSVCMLDFDIFTYYLSDRLSQHSAVIIVDTAYSHNPVGHVEVSDLLSVVNDTGNKPRSCHGFSMLNELRLAAKLGNLPRRLLLFTIEVKHKDWGEGLSIELMNRLPEISRQLEEIVRSHLDQTATPIVEKSTSNKGVS